MWNEKGRWRDEKYGWLVNMRGQVRQVTEWESREGKSTLRQGRKKKERGQGWCWVLLCLFSPFKGKLNYFTMLCLQRLQDSWAALSPYLLQPTSVLNPLSPNSDNCVKPQRFTFKTALNYQVQIIDPKNRDIVKIHNKVSLFAHVCFSLFLYTDQPLIILLQWHLSRGGIH